MTSIRRVAFSAQRNHRSGKSFGAARGDTQGLGSEMPFDSEPQTPNRDQDGENESTEDIKRTSSALSSGEGFNSNGVITLDKNRITARLACLGNDEEDELEEDWVEGGMSSSSYDLLHYGEESKQKKREAFQADGSSEC
jgi:hypothetical protein